MFFLLSGSAGHLHIVLGRSDGTTVSGHVVGDCEIFTTAEIVIGMSTCFIYTDTCHIVRVVNKIDI